MFFSRFLLTNKAIPPDKQQALLKFVTAVFETKALKPGTFIFISNQVLDGSFVPKNFM